MGRVLGLVVVGLLAVGGLLVGQGAVPCDALGTQPVCQVALRPGPSDDVARFISIDGVEEDPPGELRLTTVAVDDQLSWRSWLNARLSSSSEAVPREQIYPPGVDREQVAETNAALMADSQQVATIVALEELGFVLDGRGAVVAAVTEDAVTDQLEAGDVIVAIDGVEVSESTDVVREVQSREPGTDITLRVVSAEVPARDVEVTLGRAPDDADRPYIGVLLTTDLDLPVEVAIDAGAIGGPSAGLLFTLAIVDLLGDEDLTDGAVIAGTGTMNRDGEVGPVGGVRQKVAAAGSAVNGAPSADAFLVPRGNLDEALSVRVANDLLVVPVDTFEDALAALEALRDGRDPTDAQLLAAGR